MTGLFGEVDDGSVGVGMDLVADSCAVSTCSGVIVRLSAHAAAKAFHPGGSVQQRPDAHSLRGMRVAEESGSSLAGTQTHPTTGSPICPHLVLRPLLLIPPGNRVYSIWHLLPLR